ncbi:2-phosphosulfolactate phosphatase [Jiangella alkaliphila]|uniref:Probable 2-phosphosulfolactate phosphatase n=1 Tax=Jiangella alkaliphila TaxID=419479 RepID=A0A1H2K249_9ACTN|nr:2-phosphosulfolactate phosphatase [Jiangella alkaliphila]SDU62521.1 2-phosphosulfolactate phosphatase [Jiangella alkaliphila]
MGAWDQDGYGVRVDWGPAGARRLAPHVACLVVVDVLSFTTAVSVATDAGTTVYPYAWRDETAAAYADAVGAQLAVGRGAASARSPWSLSPAALRAAPVTPRLVLPSPNGSAIAAAASGDPAVAVVAGCLRNAAAVGRWLTASGYGTADRPVAVVPAGERWPDGSLRPALEDLLGAGAIVEALNAAHLSPEAVAARAAADAAPDLAATLRDCASGRELIAYGFPDDVDIAAERDASDVVPVLAGGGFSPA